MQHAAFVSDVAADRPTEIDLDGQTLILVRDGDSVRAFEGKCPHAGAPLAKGAVCNGKIVCPWHKAQFSLADGALLDPPALDGLASFRTEIRGDAVFVDPGKRMPATAAPRPGTTDRQVVLLGAGAAGAACASALREFGFDGRITLVGKEPDPPYDRTALSKFVLEGGKTPDEVTPLRPADFYLDRRIERVEAEVTRLDVAQRTVSLADGRSLGFTDVLVATGGTPKPLDIDGHDLAGVFTLRSKADSARIVEHAQKGGRAVILGGSFIGLEAASALRKRGLEVTIVSPEPIPFAKQFGERIGTMFRQLHEANGVTFHAETKATRLTGTTSVANVLLENGTVLPADLVLVGIGVGPATGFVVSIDLADDGGIPVDAAMAARPGIYAAGDVAHFPLDGQPTRIEHWRLAQQHARVAARAIVGEPARYDGVPFFWTYHYGNRFEYLGHATEWDDVIVEGSLEDQDFVALLVAAGKVAGVLACHRERATCLLLDRLRTGIGADDALAIIRSA